jgi:YaiO family outer membrane protein
VRVLRRRKPVKNFLRICLIALFAAALRATTEPDDNVLTRARALATHQMRPEALSLLNEHLRDHSTDADARVLYGLILSWEGHYNAARDQFKQALAAHPDYDDALRALINLELWSEHPERVDKLTVIALRNRPNDPEYLYNRARALKVLQREHEATAVVDRLLEVQPDHPHAAGMRRDLEDQARVWSVSAARTHEWFSDPKIGGWDESQLALKRRLASVSATLILRFSRGQHFGITGQQMEAEWYQHLRRGTYAYLGAGYSYDAALYPHYRLNADLYHNFPYRLEASVGIRHMLFSTNINVLTASLGRYQGNWLYTARTYLTADRNGIGHSIQLSARRYLNDKGDYYGFRFGRGSSLFESVRTVDLDVLRSTSFSAEMSRTIAHRWNLNFQAGISSEDRLHRNSLMHYLLDSSLVYRF